jgi:hypothetical protein
LGGFDDRPQLAWLRAGRQGRRLYRPDADLLDQPRGHPPFAGEAVDKAKYYAFDADYLLEMEPTVRHYQAIGEAP